MVAGRLLLLCVLHRLDFDCQHRNHSDRYQEGSLSCVCEDNHTELRFTDNHTHERDVAVLLSGERAYRRRM